MNFNDKLRASLPAREIARIKAAEDAARHGISRFMAEKEGRLDEWLLAEKEKRERRTRIRKMTRQIARGSKRNNSPW